MERVTVSTRQSQNRSMDRALKSTGARFTRPVVLVGYFVVLLVVACGIAAPRPSLPEGAVRFEPPAIYREWWAATEHCADTSKEFSSVTWYVVPGSQSIPTGGTPKVGLWYGSLFGSSIVLAGHWTESELVVRHEILHHLLSVEDHPESLFKGRCALTWDTFWQNSTREAR